MAQIRVMGIDPGLTRCGIGVVDIDPTRRVTLRHVSVTRTPVDAPLGERLAAVAAGIREVIRAYQPEVVAVERVFAQHNLQSVMGTAQASGVALLIAAEAGLPTAMPTPTEVKAAVTGYGSADKRQVQAMIARILRLESPPQPADAADALAIAICHGWRAGVGTGGGTGETGLTPAQQAWALAERKSRTNVRTFR